MNDIIYLDNAATTFPKPERVTDEILRCMNEYCGNPGRGSHTLAISASEALYECRSAASNLFGGGGADNVVFTLNATYALNIAIKSLVSSGGHVLISDLEHNAVYRPVAELALRGIISYDIFKTSVRKSETLSDIKSKIKPNTAAVICTLASNICSNETPSADIGRFCREHGILYIADGAQAAGHRRIDMAAEGIDVLCLPGHKGLYGPQGIGLIIYSHALPGITVMEGGSGINSKDEYMPEFLPERHEAGTQNTPGAVGLLAGMKFVLDVGIDAISSHERDLWHSLASRLYGDRRFRIYGEKRPSAVMLINKRGIGAAELGKSLSDRGICIRSGLHCAPLAHRTIGTEESGGVRVSFGMFNTEADVVSLCDALSKA